METLWTVITSIISNFIILIGTVTTGLLANEIFQIVIGVVVFGLIMGIVFTLVRKLKNNNKKDEWVGVFPEKVNKHKKKKYDKINAEIENEMRAMFGDDYDEFEYNYDYDEFE